MAQSVHGYVDKDPYAWVIDKKRQIRTREALQRYPRLNDSIYERSANK
jgi:hypothetical protein